MLRSEAGSKPRDKQLIELIGELSTQSSEFRTRWAAHNVRFHRTGHKRIHHPVVGTLDLDFEAMELPAHPGLTLLAYTAAAGTPHPRQPQDARQLGRHRRANRKPARRSLDAARSSCAGYSWLVPVCSR